MAANVFVSYDHDDQAQVNGFKAVKNNPNHPLDFRDHSLKEPVRDVFGKPIMYSPSDARSKPVRDEIVSKFERASKLVVLIGENTSRSEWVDWEVNTFYSMKYSVARQDTWKRIRGMTLKGSDNASIPTCLVGHAVQKLTWDPEALDKWLDEEI